jgi:UrcA family protein
MMTRILLAAATGFMVASTAFASTPAVYVEGGTKAHVRYADLNLHTNVGREILRGRIRLAATLLCNEAGPYTAERAECFRAAVNKGVGRMNQIAAR